MFFSSASSLSPPSLVHILTHPLITPPHTTPTHTHPLNVISARGAPNVKVMIQQVVVSGGSNLDFLKVAKSVVNKRVFSTSQCTVQRKPEPWERAWDNKEDTMLSLTLARVLVEPCVSGVWCASVHVTRKYVRENVNFTSLFSRIMMCGTTWSCEKCG